MPHVTGKVHSQTSLNSQLIIFENKMKWRVYFYVYLMEPWAIQQEIVIRKWWCLKV